MKLLVFGATGTTGGEVVREAILDKDIEEIAAVVRRPLDIKDAKLKIIRHENFLDYSALSEVFKNYDACAWCLGVSQTQVSEDDLHKITFDYTINAAKAMLTANPNITFLFQSGAGADNTGQSKVLFAREKGQTENALMKLGFKKLYIVRPAGIEPLHINKNTALVNKIMAPFYPLIKIFTPQFVITSVDLAKAIIKVLKNGYSKTVISNQELKQIAN